MIDKHTQTSGYISNPFSSPTSLPVDWHFCQLPGWRDAYRLHSSARVCLFEDTFADLT